MFIFRLFFCVCVLNGYFKHAFSADTLRFTLLSRKRGTNRCKATVQTQTGGDVQQQKHGDKQERGERGKGVGRGGAQTVRGKRFVGVGGK